MTLDRIAQEVLDAIRARGTHRRMRVLDGAQAPRMRVDGREVLLFAGSNYLDLAAHPEVAEASARAAHELGCAAGGSRLISGNLAIHEELEAELADFLGTEAALAFNTGYMANVWHTPPSSTAAGSRWPRCAWCHTATSMRSRPSYAAPRHPAGACSWWWTASTAWTTTWCP